MSLVQDKTDAGTVGAAPARTWRAVVREIALVVALFLAYKVGRMAADGHVAEALANAQHVWRIERLLVRLANCYYAYVHFPATAASLIWLFVRRPELYLRTRRLLAWLTAAALLVHMLMPLAPPRMLSAVGMVDTGRLLGPAVYGSPSTDTLTNQYAAMPSLHVGWALAVAIAMVGAFSGRWRWAWLAHPTITLLVVVITGNHYWLDAIVAAALLGVVLSFLTGRVPTMMPSIPKPRVSEG
jgi:hypothetical protein